MAMNTNAIGPNAPSDDELLAGVRRRMAAVEPLVPLPGTWHSAGVPVGPPVRVGIRSRIGFAGLVPLVLVAVLVVVAVGYGMGAKTWGGAGSDPSMATLTYRLVAVNGQPPVSTGLDATVAILQERLTSVNVTGFSVTAGALDTVVIKVPAEVDLAWVERIIGQTGHIDFVLLPASEYGTADAAGPKAVPASGTSIDPALAAQFTGADLDTAGIQAAPVPMNSSFWTIEFSFRSAKVSEFETWSGAHVGEYFAIVVDGKVQSVPYIRSAITGGSGEISGYYTEAQATDLAAVLRAGSLPYPLVLESVWRPGESSIVTPSVRTPTDIPSSGRTLGNQVAPVTIDLYGDFQCTACRSFMEDTEVRLIDNYVRQGKLKIVYHDFIVIDSMNGGHDSENAADAARIAADQGKFWVFSDYLWANQQNEQAGEFSRDRLIEIARLSGLDVAKFTADLDAGKYLAEVRAESATGHPAGITGTPTILVNGTQVGDVGKVPDYATISAAIDRCLASPSPSASASLAPNASPSAAASPRESASPTGSVSPTGSASPSTNALPTASASLPATAPAAASGTPEASPWLTPGASAFGPADVASPSAPH
jgi:protein-disulfide isomerase